MPGVAGAQWELSSRRSAKKAESRFPLAQTWPAVNRVLLRDGGLIVALDISDRQRALSCPKSAPRVRHAVLSSSNSKPFALEALRGNPSDSTTFRREAPRRSCGASVNRGPFRSSREREVAPQVGLEPTTLRLTAECSTIELLRIGGRGKEREASRRAATRRGAADRKVRSGPRQAGEKGR